MRPPPLHDRAARRRAWTLGALIAALSLSSVACTNHMTQLPAGRSIEARRADQAVLASSVPRRPELARPPDPSTSVAGPGVRAPDDPAPPPAEPAMTTPGPAPQTPTPPIPPRVPDPDAPRSLVLGVYPLAGPEAVIDGDTIKVAGLDASLRLLGIDTEETFKNESDHLAATMNFADYAHKKRGDDPFPAKYSTPAGERAWRWAQDWFSGVSELRLEYDDVRRTRGVYGRHLVYIFANKGGQWLNYNVEAVRAGMTPYFMKYGYATRFHDDFVAAQQEAQAARVGIWSGQLECYPDYDERLAWWEGRARTIADFHANHADDPSFFELGVESEWQRLSRVEPGTVVTVMGSLADARLDQGAPYIQYLSHTRQDKFGVVARELADLEFLDLGAYAGQIFYLQGTLSFYRGRPQMRAEDVLRYWVPDPPTE